MSSSMHVDDKGKDMLILSEKPTQGLDDMTLTAKAKYPINFIKSGTRFVLSLHDSGSKSFFFVNSTKSTSIQSKKLRNKKLCTVFK